MKHARVLLPLTAAAIIGFPVAASAQAPMEPNARGYIGGGLGYSRLNDDDFLDEDDDLKDNRWAWRVFGGIEANRVFSLEVGYVDFGESEDGSASCSGTGTGSLARSAAATAATTCSTGLGRASH